ncbi:SMP-30/gluconolactonase/LRE family protein [Longimicrobium sp.]|uniref:SMP-30/gluconolactonase/LRE family protein n=1 Tax=Longimicrobium sp. TaxID=2029185 RepID=UPI002C1A224F|nr:SMP-30/gluconolactonase/LRE family protein [Longimicrobium sp.]HSU14550.1 SMP-30/gluconolactonase/LRE family protein [Longimicrobium sp.]
MMPILRTLFCAALAVAGIAACARSGGPAPAGDRDARAKFVHAIDGFYGPESAKYDPEQDVWFISNMLGYGSDHDGAGYIVRVPAATFGPVQMFVVGGRNGATLDAPKGMAIHGDTLWVADIDVLRGFDRRTGAPLATVDFRPQHATLLNDVAVGHDGRLYVTDTGIGMTPIGVTHPGGDRVFVVGPDHAVGVVAAGQTLGRPNGIAATPRGQGVTVVSFDPFRSTVYTLDLRGETAQLKVMATGKGKYDGIEPLPDGRVLVACWNDSSVHVISPGHDRQIIRGLSQPADIGVDTRRGIVAIPQSVRDRVEFWKLPPEQGD